MMSRPELECGHLSNKEVERLRENEKEQLFGKSAVNQKSGIVHRLISI